MGYVLLVLASLLLLVGFVVLVWYEKGRDVRFFAQTRTRLDQKVERIEFIIERVDFGAFIREELRRGASRLGHVVAHVTLQAVRAVERILTRAVRNLRVHHTIEVGPRENTREFVKTLSDFKERLKDTMPDMPDVQ